MKKATAEKIVRILARDGCSTIFEIGVGTGRVAKPLQDRNLKVVGVDISRGMIAHWQRISCCRKPRTMLGPCGQIVT